MDYTKSGLAELAYESTPSRPDGGAVLLMHAGVNDRRSWASLTPRLSARLQVIAYDARGFGDTRYQPEPYSPVADALAVLDAAGVQRASVVGASMGGRTALDFALTHPDRVDRLVLIGPGISGAPVIVDDPEPVRTLAEAMAAADDRGDVDEVNRLEAHLWLDGPTAAEGRVTGAARELFLDMNGKALRAEDPGDRLPIDPPAWDRLAEVSVPTLVLDGELDLDEVHDRCTAVAEQVPGAELIRLPGVAHLPHLENDQTCLDAIARFLT